MSNQRADTAGPRAVTDSSARDLSASQHRRDQRRRSATSGGGSLADERSQLIAEPRRTRPAEHLGSSAAQAPAGAPRYDAGEGRAARRDRAAITWLATPVALGPRSRIVGYDRAIVPRAVAELLDGAPA